MMIWSMEKKHTGLAASKLGISGLFWVFENPLKGRRGRGVKLFLNATKTFDGRKALGGNPDLEWSVLRYFCFIVYIRPYSMG